MAEGPAFVPAAAEETVFLPVEVSSVDMALAPPLADNLPVQQPGCRIEIELAKSAKLQLRAQCGP